MPSSPAEQIKEKLDIVEFIKSYLPLKPAGKNFKALCPFHQEKTPSFMVSPDRQSWHCFGCNSGGDIFSFLMRYENLEFAEALRILADKTGVELRRLSPEEYKFFGLLYDLNDAAKEFFKKELANSEPAKKYLADRGLKQEIIQEFEIGFAPNTPEALNLYFINVGHNPDDVLRSGLALKTEGGAQLDRFRGRIMFPIWNNAGKVVGFTGRILPQFDTGNLGKYVNSPETPIFNKSKVLYGFHKSKESIRETKSAFLVEGQTDFLMCWQAGVKNVVASSGTALTLDHLRALKRLTDEIIISFDNDEAGWAAGERAIDLAESADFNVKVVTWREHKDAAEAAQANPDNLKQTIAKAKPAPEFYFEKYLKEGAGDLSNRENLKNLRAVLAKIKNILSPVSQSFWLKELSKRTGLAEKVLAEEAEKLESGKTYTSPIEIESPVPELAKFTRRELISQRILSHAYQKNNFQIIAAVASYFAPGYEKILELLKSGEKSSSDLNLDQVISLITLRFEELTDAELDDLKDHLIQEYLKDKRAELAKRIRDAESKNDEITLRAALQELNQLNHTNV